jgi:beta-glucosidase
MLLTDCVIGLREAKDEMVDYVVKHVKAKMILDLVHYGTPPWLEVSFVDPAFPDALAQYAAEVAARYRRVVGAYTPLNEPLVTASFCGLRAVWPPYLSGDMGRAAVPVSVMDGVQRAIRSIRRVDKDAEIVHVDAVVVYGTEDSSLDEEVRSWERRARLPARLLLGRVDPEDEDWSWLERHGVDPAALDRLRRCGERPDVLGLNYYPELSCREIVRLDGRVVHVAVDGGVEAI